ncbi:hypothetical protein HY450_00275 [Candidatus Pacearchaeota archaeon]|nr:hypothetical protein [Candidatus Pacearchaeota archaeon]
MKKETDQNENGRVLIPSLVKQGVYSNDPDYGNHFQRRIENPMDTGLREIVETVYAEPPPEDVSSGYGSNTTQDFAIKVIEDLETNLEAIRKRQAVLREFKNNPELRKIAKRGYYGHISCNSEHSLSDYQDECRELIRYATELNRVLQESDTPTLEDFATSLKEYEEGYLSKLERRLQQTERPFRFTLKNFRTRKRNEATIKTEDGTIYTTNRGTYSVTEEYPVHQIVERIKKRVSGKGISKVYKKQFTIENRSGQNFVNVKIPVKRLQKLRTLWETVKRGEFKPVYRDEVEEKTINFGRNCYGEYRCRWSLKDNLVGQAILSDGVDEKRNFKGTIHDIRYFATLAEKLPQLAREAGVSLTTPRIASVEEKLTSVRDMYDPLLVTQEHKKIVPNDVNINRDRNVFVITGPNGGGKTSYVNSIVNNTALAQAGWDIFAEEVTISPKEKVITRIVRQPNPSAQHSRYQRELAETIPLFEKVTSDSLVILDEPYTGTSYEDGLHQLSGVVEQLHRAGATTLVPTHYHALAKVAERLLYADNLRVVAEDRDGKLHYTFKVESGNSNNSEGKYVAREMGADPDSLAKTLEERARKEELVLR